MPESNENKNVASTSLRLKVGLAEMLKGGVIMDVMNVEQARIAEEAGAVSVMALERVPAMIRAEGGVARMAKPSLIKQIIQTVSIPVMAKARIGHFAEAQILQELGVDFIDESEVLTPPTRPITSTSTPSPPLLSAARATWARLSGASPRARP
jgi:pyridoxal 5'-phosphate synthase pdxS subunit